MVARRAAVFRVGGKGVIRFVALAVAFGLAGGAVSEPRQLRFDWPKASANCWLIESGPATKKIRHVGAIEQQDMGTVCTVQMGRRQFDATYKTCAIDYADSVPREHYACWLTYTPREVVFLYSYSDEPLAAPGCAFVCATR